MLLLVVATAATPAFADRWYEHYARAEQALDQGNWSKAVEELNEALERKGDSGARERTYGMRVVAYFPYLNLGVAYYRLGQHEAALQAFETEERLGAIRESAARHAELRRYRQLAEEGQRQRAASEAQRITRIVEESLRQARAMVAQGRLQEAIEALDRAVAVAPDHPEASDLLARLRDEASRRERQREDASRAARLLAEGRALLDSGENAQAASLLRQALEIGPSAEASSLLARAEQNMRLALPTGGGAPSSTALIAEALGEVRDLEAAGRVDEAFDRLQPVLAVDPQNASARSTLERLLTAQATARRQQAIGEALAASEAAYAEDRFERSLTDANRALALDSANLTAREHVRRAHREISRRLLGFAAGGNIPPAIRFADFREEQPDGPRVERVRDPDFRLSGVAIDGSAVRLACFDAAGQELESASSSQRLGEVVLTEFVLRRRLPSGVSTFRVVATDSEGASSSAEYAVDYVRPFFRSPWLAVGVAALPLLAVVGVLAHRLRRRRRLLRRRFNPYVAGAPVLDERLFFGRDRLLDRILQTIHNNSLLLHGERRIGKTSMLHHLKRRLEEVDDPDFSFHPVFIDLQGTREERFFATVIDEIRHELAPLLEGAEGVASSARDGGYEFSQFLGELRAVLHALQRRTSKRVKLVLLIDEVDELNAYDPRINQRLRSLFMKSLAENLVAVVAGVGIRKQWEREASPWYNFFEEIELGAIERADAEDLVTRPIKGVFEVEPGVVDCIVTVSGCKPYRIQRLCVALVNRLHDEGRRRLTLADVEAVAGGDGP